MKNLKIIFFYLYTMLFFLSCKPLEQTDGLQGEAGKLGRMNAAAFTESIKNKGAVFMAPFKHYKNPEFSLTGEAPPPGGHPDPVGQLDPRDHPDPVGQLDPRDHPDPVGQLDPRDHPDPVGQLDPRDHPDPVGQLDPRDHPDPVGHPDPAAEFLSVAILNSSISCEDGIANEFDLSQIFLLDPVSEDAQSENNPLPGHTFLFQNGEVTDGGDPALEDETVLGIDIYYNYSDADRSSDEVCSEESDNGYCYVMMSDINAVQACEDAAFESSSNLTTVKYKYPLGRENTLQATGCWIEILLQLRDDRSEEFSCQGRESPESIAGGAEVNSIEMAPLSAASTSGTSALFLAFANDAGIEGSLPGEESEITCGAEMSPREVELNQIFLIDANSDSGSPLPGHYFLFQNGAVVADDQAVSFSENTVIGIDIFYNYLDRSAVDCEEKSDAGNCYVRMSDINVKTGCETEASGSAPIYDNSTGKTVATYRYPIGREDSDQYTGCQLAIKLLLNGDKTADFSCQGPEVSVLQ